MISVRNFFYKQALFRVLHERPTAEIQLSLAQSGLSGNFLKLLGLESDSTTEALLFYRFTSSGETSFVLDVLQRRYQVFF